MAKTPVRAALLAGMALWLAPTANAQVTPKTILDYPPRQAVQISTPTPEEQARCKVENITRPGGSGFVLTDPAGKKLRAFYDVDGDKKIDIFCYFKDGVEVYREIDSKGKGRTSEFRWLGPAGMKWGLDLNEDGKIDNWRMISAEEAGQEALLALAANDFDRLKTLLITEAEMKAIKLPAAQIEKLLTLQKQAKAKFQTTRDKLPQLASALFEQVESAVPSCDAADTSAEQDVIKFPSRMVLYSYDAGKDKKRDWLETGEMIQVGYAWRLTDVPVPQGGGADPVVAKGPPELQKHYDELFEHDKKAPPPLGSAEKNEKVAQFNVLRVAILKKIVAVEPAENQREIWIKQMCDNLSTAHQAHDATALTQLTALRGELAKKEPTGSLTAYAVYREMWAPYARKIADVEDGPTLTKVQEQWHEQLAKYVVSYPKSEDAPDALWQLAMGAEHLGKDEESKRWYQQIYTSFPGNSLAEKAKGAERRLGLVGREMELKGPMLNAPGAFDIANTKGKVVVVYYWASNVSVCPANFATLKALVAAHGVKGLEIVTVNLDDSKDEAHKFLTAHGLPAHHVYQDGKEGLNGPLANYYGINSLPTVFLIGRDGRVQNRTLQVSDLEVALKKAL